ncbi:MAG: DNA recombination protein RmuC [Nanoarchaeota archaeon]
MEILIILLIAVLVVGFVVLGFLINHKQNSNQVVDLMKIIQASSAEDRKILINSLSQNTQSFNLRLDNAAKVISDVQRSLGEVSEIGRSMKDVGEFLKSPKLRGNIGEQILRELLKQHLPQESFHIQYAFKSGEKVDAAIKTSGGIIPIDSKFPMENFRKMAAAKDDVEKQSYEKVFEKDVRAHIDSISRKYVLPQEGTIDYALMYIPSESVYYEIANNSNLFDYSHEKRVLPVSPTTFYAYLRAILMSFEGQKIEASAKAILASLRAIQKDYEKVNDNLSVLQKHLNNAYNSITNVVSSFGQLGQKITSTKSLDSGKKD